jgi:hypothetical protein
MLLLVLKTGFSLLNFGCLNNGNSTVTFVNNCFWHTLFVKLIVAAALVDENSCSSNILPHDEQICKNIYLSAKHK